MLYIAQQYLPFLGSVIGTHMLIRMALVEKKLQTNPDTTKAILGFTGISIALGLLSPIIVGRLETALERA
jgi:hypothetical protein